MIEPYYSEGGIVVHCADARDVLPTLGRFDLLLTDPPYGINQDKGMGGGGFDGFGGGRSRTPKKYAGDWDNERPPSELMARCFAIAERSIIWGGNVFADNLPSNPKWLVWDKEQTMPSYSDAELAWTNLVGTSVKMFRFNGSGIFAREKDRSHPTQKPLPLMQWCLSLVPDAKTVLDPFGGSLTTAVACKLAGIECTIIEREEKYCEKGVKRLAQGVLNFDA